MWWLFAAVAAIVAGVVILELSLQVVQNWFDQRKGQYTMGSLMRERLENGNYKVVAGVLSRGEVVEATSWEAETLSAELEQRFGPRDRITIDV